jgi:hypothetical protein
MVNLSSQESDELDSCNEGNYRSIANVRLSLAPDWWLGCWDTSDLQAVPLRTRVQLPFLMNALAMPQAYRRLFSMQATILIGHESPGDIPAQMIGHGPRIASHAEDDAALSARG